MFKCPHCSAENSVALDGVGRPAACAACGLPFLAHAPAATLLKRDGEQWVTAGQTPDANHPRHADEQTLASVNPAVFREHPVQTLLLTLLIVGGLTVAIQFGRADDPNFGTTALAAAGLVFALAALAVLVIRFVGSRFESLTVTTQRSIWARGIINRQTSEVQHDDIRNIQVSQTIIERLFNAGSVAISSAGQGDMEIIIKGVPNPRAIVETVRTYQRKLVKDD